MARVLSALVLTLAIVFGLCWFRVSAAPSPDPSPNSTSIPRRHDDFHRSEVLPPSPSTAPTASPSLSPAPASPSPHPSSSPPSAPQASPSASPVPQASPEGLPPLKLASLYAGDEEGYPCKVFYAVEPAIYFYATLKADHRKRDGRLPGVPPNDRSFWLSVRDPRGIEVARLGGALDATLDAAHADVPRDCQGHPPNGLQIADTSLASHPGQYHVLAFLDGAPAGDIYFLVKELHAAGEVTITSAAVEDAQGARKFTFTTHDRGAYAHVTLVNASRKLEHDHLLQVAFVGPSGRVGRLLGGVISLHKGTHLDGRDFPVLCDRDHHDGILIQGTPLTKQTGAWKMIVYLDGRVAREVPFRLVPFIP